MSAQRHTFQVAMTCEGCSGAVQRVLGKLGDKVWDVKIDLDSKQVKVTSTLLSKDELLEVINKTGKDTSYLSSEPA